MRYLALLFAVGCTPHAPAALDADVNVALPSCISEGCGDEPLYCMSADRCLCPQPDGTRVECQNVPPPPDAGAVPDGVVFMDANRISDPRIDAAIKDAP